MLSATTKSLFFAIVAELIAFFALVQVDRGLSITYIDIIRISVSFSVTLFFRPDSNSVNTTEKTILINPKKHRCNHYVKFGFIIITGIVTFGIMLLDDTVINSFDPNQTTIIYDVLFFIVSFGFTFVGFAALNQQPHENDDPITDATKIKIVGGLAKAFIFACVYLGARYENVDMFEFAVTSTDFLKHLCPWVYGFGGLGSAIAFYYSIRSLEKNVEVMVIEEDQSEVENYGTHKCKSINYISV